MLNYDHPKQVVLVCGTGGHGKSTFIKKILDAQKAPYWFFYDHKSEFSSRFGMEPSFDIPSLAAQLARTGKVCFNPSRLYPGDKPAGFRFFCDFVFTFSEVTRGRKILVCDELQQMAFQEPVPELVALMDDGRSREIDCFFIAQSTNQLHNMVQNQFTEIFTFRQAHKRATEHLTTLGLDENEICELRPGEWIFKNCTSGEIRRGGSAFKIKPSTATYLQTSRKRLLPKNDGK